MGGLERERGSATAFYRQSKPPRSHSALSLTLALVVKGSSPLCLDHGNVRDSLFAEFASISCNATSCNKGGSVLFHSLLVSGIHLVCSLSLSLLALLLKKLILFVSLFCPRLFAFSGGLCGYFGLMVTPVIWV